MHYLIRWSVFIAVLVASSTPVFAQFTQQPGPLEPGGGMVWGAIGMQGDVGGSVNSSGIGVVNGARAEINTNTWGERYDAALIVRAGGAFNLSSHDQVFVAFAVQQAEADGADIGLVGGQALTGTFSDYQGWGLDAGYRYVIETSTSAKPFVSASLGVDRIQEISLSLSSGSFNASDIPFYADSFVMSWRVGTGFLWNINDRLGAIVSLDLKYNGVLSDRSGIGAIGFERINNTGNRWTLPLMGGVYVKF
jgi:hypothetical protein